MSLAEVGEIHPDKQGRGIGTRLITAILDQATRQGQDLTVR